MPVIAHPTEPTHALPNARFTSLCTPSRGSRETSLWRVELTPGAPPTPHQVTREELFVIVRGVAQVTLDGAAQVAQPGDVIVVPPDTTFTIACADDHPVEALCCLPVGGQARVDGQVFTPPWAQ